ncbi:mechanosensitive ion channel domain-containing protein [Flavihumibacter petaseus]|uniref:mechanosensitive ion channel domain-containing protein n=1 Tax=Flavihumibacter petaseus TaxID=549295 RepID=UPI0014702D1F|nr:mechanosensitive ion channel domain-containing protein [Flavihumibacter petaseus]
MNAQNRRDSTQLPVFARSFSDSTFDRMQSLISREHQKSIDKYREGRIALRQRQIIQASVKTAQDAKAAMHSGIDTAAITRELHRGRENLEVIKDGIFIHEGIPQTSRNLAVSNSLAIELYNRISSLHAKVDAYLARLDGYRDKLDSLGTDSAVYSFPRDSLKMLSYFHQLLSTSKTISPLDTALNQHIQHLETYTAKIEILQNDVRLIVDDLEKLQKENTRNLFNKEAPDLWNKPLHKRPFKEIAWFSLAKTTTALKYYIEENAGKIAILICLVLLDALMLYILKKRMREEGQLTTDDYKGQLVIRYPLLSAIVLIFSIFQFIFINPPILFDCCLWLVAMISLTLILRGYISAFWLRFCWIILTFYLLAVTADIILQASRTERWYLLIISLAGAIYGISLLSGKHAAALKEVRTKYFVLFMVFCETVAFFFNIAGRYNLSKALFMAGFFGLVIALLFLWTIRLSNEALALSSRVYRLSSKKLFYINFEKIGDRVPSFFYFLMVIGWLVQVGRNFYAFRQLTDPVNQFLDDPVTVGSYSFTIKGILIFIVILLGAMILSRVISFFTDEPEALAATDPNAKPRATIGSWMLLVRIVVISGGLFLAFAAAGIPLDRLTIIFGALSVGIGLGLQGLVNNLVSGLIIAFEKPVNVGDLIEIKGMTGTMKSIGFRSSIITLKDGSSLVIPNGDLLGQHMVNWSMNRNLRRLEVTVGVAYGTDLDNAKAILQGILEADTRILKNPSYRVLNTAFNTSSVDFVLLFWANDFALSFQIKSDVINQVHRAFHEAGIVIPFPQTDLHLRTYPKDLFTQNHSDEKAD